MGEYRWSLASEIARVRLPESGPGWPVRLSSHGVFRY